jgi:hypothetical protein
MQPLSKVKPDAAAEWGESTTMMRRPDLAIKVARCIAQWAEVEIHLGALLGLLLHTNEKAAVAMYSALENRTAQLRMLSAAAEATLPTHHNAVIAALLSAIVRPAMKERDRLAHWSWGHSDDLPDALLLSDQDCTLESLMQALRIFPGVERAPTVTSFDSIYVVRSGDLDGIIRRNADAKMFLRIAMATVWDHNPQHERDEYLQQLCGVPAIREALDRQVRKDQKTP